jgi:hypothetical protein
MLTVAAAVAMPAMSCLFMIISICGTKPIIARVIAITKERGDGCLKFGKYGGDLQTFPRQLAA